METSATIKTRINFKPLSNVHLSLYKIDKPCPKYNCRLNLVEVRGEELLEVGNHGVDGRRVLVQHHIDHVLEVQRVVDPGIWSDIDFKEICWIRVFGYDPGKKIYLWFSFPKVSDPYIVCLNDIVRILFIIWYWIRIWFQKLIRSSQLGSTTLYEPTGKRLYL